MKLRFRIDDPYDKIFDVIVRVTSDGMFNCMLPDDVAQLFKDNEIKLGYNRNRKYGYFSEKTLRGVEEAIAEKIKMLCSMEEVFRDKVIRYCIETTCSYYITDKNDFAPNGCWPGVRKEDKWRSGTRDTDACNRAPTGIRIYAQPFLKIVRKHKFSDHTVTAYKSLHEHKFGDFKEDDPIEWLTQLVTIAEPNHHTLRTQEIPYTEEAGWFFVNLYKAVFAMNEKIKPFVDSENIQKLIKSGSNLLGGGEPEKCEHGKGLTDYCEPCGRVHSA